MGTFAELQAQSEGQLTGCDRVLFKGHLTRLYPSGNFSWFLKTQGVLLKDYKPYASQVTCALKEQVQAWAAEQGRPYRYLGASYTARQGQAKEDIAREIAAQDGITDGLSCVLGSLELNTVLSVRGNRQTHELEVVREPRKFAHREWARVLQAFARQVNPFLPTLAPGGYAEYYWSTQQCEIATDLMFPERATLGAYVPEVYQQALLAFGASDVMQFLGRKLHGNYQGEVSSDLKYRPTGWRVKHRAKGNSLKMYDKLSVLRVETTINNAGEFKVPKSAPDGSRRWQRMGKGVANFWRCYQVGQQANQRYLDALAGLPLQGEGVQALDALCRTHTKDGKHYARFEPLARETERLFRAVLAGEHLLNGFRNRDLQAQLYPQAAATTAEARRRCARVSRCIAKLRGHGLIAKVKDARLYRVTQLGRRVMSAVVQFRLSDFPNAYCSI